MFKLQINSSQVNGFDWQRWNECCPEEYIKRDQTTEQLIFAVHPNTEDQFPPENKNKSIIFPGLRDFAISPLRVSPLSHVSGSCYFSFLRSSIIRRFGFPDESKCLSWRPPRTPGLINHVIAWWSRKSTQRDQRDERGTRVSKTGMIKKPAMFLPSWYCTECLQIRVFCWFQLRGQMN